MKGDGNRKKALNNWLYRYQAERFLICKGYILVKDIPAFRLGYVYLERSLKKNRGR